ncbi:MAG TPA: EamA family transporter [Dokdonella sp.]
MDGARTDEDRIAAVRGARLRERATVTSFVLLWCTGYPAGKIAVSHGGPFATLFLRFGCATVVLAVLAFAARAAWPGLRALSHSAVVGLLSLAVSFGGIYAGLRLGVSTGISALFIGAMPLMTALFASLLGERLGRWQWCGLALGFAGVVLVLEGRLGGGTAGGLGYVACLIGLLGLSLGTLYQKRHASNVDLRVGLAAQNAAAALAMLPLAAFVDRFAVDGSRAYAGALGWLVFVNSVGGFGLLFALLRRGAATAVAALFYLVPPITAVMGYVVLGERLSPAMLPGFALVALGVWLGTRREPVS